MKKKSRVAWINLFLSVHRCCLQVLVTVIMMVIMMLIMMMIMVVVMVTMTLRAPLTRLTRVTRVRSELQVTWLENRLLTRGWRHVPAPETHCLHAGSATEDVSVTLNTNIET